MMMLKKKILTAIQSAETTLIAGIDPDYEKIPQYLKSRFSSETECVEGFCKAIIEKLSPIVCGFKFNLAFFEALGPKAFVVLKNVLDVVPDDKLIIADAKRGDIGNTAQKYADAFFHSLNCDFITVNPLMGFETIEPFLGDGSKGVFCLALTSNPGADDFLLKPAQNGEKMAVSIAAGLKKMQKKTDTVIGMVTGATQTEHLRLVLAAFSEAPLLIPGLGAQGGDIPKLIQILESHKGVAFPVISRAIIYASDGEDWQQKAEEKAIAFKNELSPLYKV